MPKQSNTNWTELKIYPRDPQPSDMNKSWRVEFRYLDEKTGTWSKPLAYKKGVNYIHNYKERIAEINALKKGLLYKLQFQGWNPIHDTYPEKSASELEIERLQQLTLSEALDFSYQKKLVDWKKKTGQDYNSVIRYLKQSAAGCGLSSEKICALKRRHFRLLLEEVTMLRKLSAKGFNKYREYLSSLVAELVQWDVMEYNLIRDIKTKTTIRKVAHRPPTQDQRLIIVEKIKSEHRNYYRFLAVLYGCTIRPKEITRLKIKHLHKLEQVFRLVPDRKEENTKTPFEREVPIPNWVMDLLSELNLHNHNPEWYIFSTRNKYGSFLPGPTRMHSNTPTLWWRRIVKDPVIKGGLGLNVDQYSLKKLSGDDMVKLQRREQATGLLELPKMMMGHTTTAQTEDYVSEHKEVMKALIKEKMPEL